MMDIRPPNRVYKIAIEEHFDAPGIVKEDYDGSVFASFPPAFIATARKHLADIDDGRVAAMDKAGIDFTVLSQTSPGVQIELDAAKATRLARDANDFLAERIRRHPSRLGGFAHLALQDPKEG